MIIVIHCKDQVGLVAAITGVLSKLEINIISMREYVDMNDRYFFARLEVDFYPETQTLKNSLLQSLPRGTSLDIITNPGKKILVLATREHHCLSDILVRHHFNTLGAEIGCVIANHDNLRDIAQRFNIPFFHISSEGKTKAEYENELMEKINEYEFDYIVLAKFMRILSPEFVKNYLGKIINIHHSFLPAFIGANPYKKAFERGVKLIGATAHFVTNDLDEGPIIAQKTIPVTHAYTLSKMINSGKEIETAVLSEALKLVLEDRVFIYQNKTVVFE